MRKYEAGPVRSMADVDAELALLQVYEKTFHYFEIFFLNSF